MNLPTLGVWTFPSRPADELVELIVSAERLGLEQFWLGDEGPAREPFSVLAGAAVRTRHMVLGIGITNALIRPPAVTAVTAQTVAELAGGRFVLGIGAGGELSLEPFGLGTDRPYTATVELLEVVRAVAAGAAVAGHYEPADHAMPGTEVPIFVGGRGRRMNLLASERADGVFLSGLHPDRYDEVVGWARSVRDIDVALYPSVVFDDAEATDRWSEPVAAGAVWTDADGHLEDRLVEVATRHRPSCLGLSVLDADLDRALPQAAAVLTAARARLR